MIRSFVIAFFIMLCISFVVLRLTSQAENTVNPTNASWWAVQSVDTMKYSRDLAREKMNSVSFDAVIDEQVKNIAKTGATHVAIATPYDEEFVPMLSRWVAAARKHNLGVWFRGNFSGWEQWFDRPRMSREEHLTQTLAFLHGNTRLFVDGDIFTACPECENGGPGDPRQTGDVDGFRLFMITEHNAIASVFADLGKRITINYNSMNYDVASLVMDRATTSSMGGVVAIDHYVASPKKLAEDVTKLARASGGGIFLAEFGAPIPDIHGDMNDQRQAQWIEEAFYLLSSLPDLIGVNYWVNVGGSTQLWYNNDTPKASVSVLTKYFTPKQIMGRVYDQYNRPIANAEVTSSHKSTKTDRTGQFTIPVLPSDTTLFVHGDKYTDMETQISDSSTQMKIIIHKTNRTPITSILDFFNSLFK